MEDDDRLLADEDDKSPVDRATRKELDEAEREIAKRQASGKSKSAVSKCVLAPRCRRNLPAAPSQLLTADFAPCGQVR